jgi:O-antigen/teichoic acid export membrane protein
LTAWRPFIGLAVLVIAVPLTTGLGRGTVIPVLRPNEAILAVVAAGAICHAILERRRRTFDGLDLALFSFVGGGIVIAGLVLFVSHSSDLHDLDTLRAVLGPAQFLAFYWLASRALLTDREFRTVLNLAMFASLVVGFVAIAELANVPGARDFVLAYFPPLDLVDPASPVFRPTSTLGHFSSVGAFAALNYILALALATGRHPGFSRPWLGLVVCVNLAAVIASQTWAPLLGLSVATPIILWHARRFPRELGLALAALALSLVLFWPAVSARAGQQEVYFGAGPGALIPQTLQTRMRWWEEFFLPAISDHVLFGTGTVIPSTVPERLSGAVDNEYLGEVFRAGLLGLGLLILVLSAIAASGWRARASPDPGRRALGGACVAAVLSLALIGMTAEYLTYGGVSQEFALLVGLFAGLAYRARATADAGVLVIASPAPFWRVPIALPPVARRLRRLVPETAVIRSSAIVFIGLSVARLFGFLFSVAAARLLLPSDYGLLAYSLGIAGIATTLLTTVPKGLSRFVARHGDDQLKQDAYFSNWMLLVGLTLAASILLLVPIAMLSRLTGWMVVGLLANLLGVAVFEAYRESQRGLDRFGTIGIYYMLANALELVAVLLAAAAGFASAPLFLTIYGLSNVVALAVVQLAAPLRLRFLVQSLAQQRVRRIARFVRPMLLQTLFYGIWFSTDLILVQRFLGPTKAGNYAAAKVLVTILALAPLAIQMVIGPHVARLAETDLRRYVLRFLALTAAATVPVAVGVWLLDRPLLALAFGGRYPDALQPLPILILAITLHAFQGIFENVWLGLGRPQISAVASGVGLLCTVISGLAIIRPAGLLGAAIAFAVGAAAQLALIAGYTAWALPAGPAQRVDDLADQVMWDEPPPFSAASAP